MADAKISALTAASALAGPEEFPANQGGNSRKVTAEQIKTFTGKLLGEQHVDGTVASTTADTSLAAFTVPGGLLVAGDVLRLRGGGRWLNTSGSAASFDFSMKIGTTAIAVPQFGSIASAANFRRFWWDVEIVIESTTAQRVSGMFFGTAAGAGSVQALVAANSYAIDTETAENTATAKDVALFGKVSASHASLSITLRSASLTLHR